MLVPYTYRDVLLKLDHVSLEYDGRPILRDVCAEIRDVYIPGRVTGQIVALLGPSGCGKTQTFRCIAGLQRPTSGQVLLKNSHGFHPVQIGDVGVVAQDYPLFAHRTIAGNLMIAAAAHEPDPKKAKARVEEGLENFNIADKGDLYPCQLSGGQRQRVAILQMLICKEPFILLDEPFSGLDLINLEIACETISHAANLAEENTFIITTHDVSAAVAIADHVLLLGLERDSEGKCIPGARVVESYDLLERGLCYSPGIITEKGFMECVAEIKNRFRTLAW